MRKIPRETISRLSASLTALLYLPEEKSNISSFELANITGSNPNQLRKDLSYFGKFGRRGIGYSVKELIDNLKNILGMNKTWNVALCGLGNLGKALASYKGFSQQGLIIRVILEKDSKKIGKKFAGIDVLSIDQIRQAAKKHRINIAVLAVPVDQAQSIAEEIYKAGVRAILNFAPLNLNIGPGCFVRNVYMSSDLTYLTYSLGQRGRT